MAKKIGLTYDLEEDYELKAGDPHDLYRELDDEDTIDFLGEIITELGFAPVKIGNFFELDKNIGKLKNELAMVFNISEGIKGRNRESQVPMLLELYDIPYSGSDALSLGVSLDKSLSKIVFKDAGITTPLSQVIETREDCENISLPYPLIMKPCYEGSSKGLTENSRVTNKEELIKQFEYLNKFYKQPILVEQFITGTEFTVPVIGNEDAKAYKPVQMFIDGQSELGDKFFFAALGSRSEEDFYLPPKNLDPIVAEKMKVMSVAAHKSLHCLDFSRSDFRVDTSGQPYILEINCLPLLAEGDAFTVAAEMSGISHKEIVTKVIKTSLARHKLI